MGGGEVLLPDWTLEEATVLLATTRWQHSIIYGARLVKVVVVEGLSHQVLGAPGSQGLSQVSLRFKDSWPELRP